MEEREKGVDLRSSCRFRTGSGKGKNEFTATVAVWYLFTANLDNPKLYEIFEAILKKPATYEELKKLLDQAAGKGKKTGPKVPFSVFYTNIKTVKSDIPIRKQATHG